MDYRYSGDRATAPELKGQLCKAVRRPDGRCIRGRNGNMLVTFENGQTHVIVARRLKKLLTFRKPHTMNTAQNKAFKSFQVNGKFDRSKRNYFIEHDGKILEADAPDQLFGLYLDALGIQRPARMAAATLTVTDGI